MKSIILFLSFAFFSMSAWVSESEENFQPCMRFKLGLEFQEITGLCPWAVNNETIQKEPLFFLKHREDSNPELWHLVLDTSDIEYVTRPFTCFEKELFQTCIDTIHQSLSSLQDLLKENNYSCNFETFYFLMKNIFKQGDLPFMVNKCDLFNVIKDRELTVPAEQRGENWSLRLAPQATIQHHLEDTILLYFALYGFKTTEMLSFIGSLPFKDFFKKALEECEVSSIFNFKAAYQQKSAGLIFLHALTLFRLALFAEFSEEEVLDNSIKNLEGSFQIDAKMCLTLMSRRPFSEMLKNVRIRNYATMFWNFMNKNTIFKEQMTHFENLNYGHQFTTSIGYPQDLTYLADKLNEDFYEENKQSIDYLLKQGTLTTLMLRNLKTLPQDLFKDYLINSIKSVEHPSRRYIINLESDRLIEEEASTTDVLSPPHFLPLNDSMGSYREGLNAEELESYGEAIVELRNVKNLGPYFFEASQLLKEKQTQFLCDYTAIREDSAALFNFLYNFGDTHKAWVYLLMGHEVRRNVH